MAWILVVATLRVMTQQGAPQYLIAGFTLAVVLAVLGASSLYESSKRKAEAKSRFVGEMPEPSFPVPSLPGRKEIE